MTEQLNTFKTHASEMGRRWFPILGGYAASFDLTNGINYFAGNSLGLMPTGVEQKMLKHLKLWKELQHDAHFASNGNNDRPWWRYQEKLVPTAARLLGAKDDPLCPEVALFNTLSTNNRNLIETFAMYIRDSSSTGIPTIVTTATNFPSDDVGLKYALQVVFGNNFRLMEIKPDADGLYNFNKMYKIIKTEPNVKMGFFPGLCYTTGQRFPIKDITEALHDCGAIAGFDLAHSMGNYQLNLHDDKVDFATFCGYKYLNGGPGAVGGIFVHQRWFATSGFKPVSGWFGIHMDDRFNFNPDQYRPAPGAWGFLQSNDQIMNMQGVEAYFDLVDLYGEANIFKFHEEISSFMYECLKCIPGVSIVTPQTFSKRGCQISFKIEGISPDAILAHMKGHSFCEKRGAFIRVAPVGYNSFMHAWAYCNHLAKIVV